MQADPIIFKIKKCERMIHNEKAMIRYYSKIITNRTNQIVNRSFLFNENDPKKPIIIIHNAYRNKKYLKSDPIIRAITNNISHNAEDIKQYKYQVLYLKLLYAILSEYNEDHYKDNIIIELKTFIKKQCKEIHACRNDYTNRKLIYDKVLNPMITNVFSPALKDICSFETAKNEEETKSMFIAIKVYLKIYANVIESIYTDFITKPNNKRS